MSQTKKDMRTGRQAGPHISAGKRSALPVLVFLLSLFWLTGQASAGGITPDLAARVAKAAPTESIPVIITLSEQLDLQKVPSRKGKSRREALTVALREKAERTQGNLKRFLQRHHADNIISFWIFNGMAATVRADRIAGLAALPEVSSVRPDGIITAPRPVSLSLVETEWNIEAIRAPVLWGRGFTGNGIVVAGMDTGVDPDHPDLAPRWRGGGNSWYDPAGEHPTPSDNNGHGTQTMGLMVGGDAGGSAVGVAPDARWIAVKIFDDQDEASYSTIHLGFQWLLDPDDDPATDDQPDVVNNSWGFDQAVDECVTEFRPDVRALRTAGITVVFAAGNTGPGSATSISPANYPESFAAGAVKADRGAADFSARGPSACDGGLYPDLMAPGVNVKAPSLTLGGTVADAYDMVSGTSFAAPLVAGGMALLLSAFPELTVDELERTLVRSAVDLGEPGSDMVYGHGMIDLWAAYASLQPVLQSDLPAGILFFLPVITAAASDRGDQPDEAENP